MKSRILRKRLSLIQQVTENKSPKRVSIFCLDAKETKNQEENMLPRALCAL